MAKACEICSKGPTVGHWRKLLRGNYNVTGKRRFRPNLQPLRVDGKKVKACVGCIRNSKKKSASASA